MAPRLQLHELLVGVLGEDRRDQVYFQAPPDNQMVYPCILYKLDDLHTEYADNDPYTTTKGYQVTVIDRDPDSEIPDQIALLRMSRFDRRFVFDNLNHTVFNLYF